MLGFVDSIILGCNVNFLGFFCDFLIFVHIDIAELSVCDFWICDLSICNSNFIGL